MIRLVEDPLGRSADSILSVVVVVGTGRAIVTASEFAVDICPSRCRLLYERLTRARIPEFVHDVHLH